MSQYSFIGRIRALRGGSAAVPRDQRLEAAGGNSGPKCDGRRLAAAVGFHACSPCRPEPARHRALRTRAVAVRGVLRGFLRLAAHVPSSARSADSALLHGSGAATPTAILEPAPEFVRFGNGQVTIVVADTFQDDRLGLLCRRRCAYDPAVAVLPHRRRRHHGRNLDLRCTTPRAVRHQPRDVGPVVCGRAAAGIPMRVHHRAQPRRGRIHRPGCSAYRNRAHRELLRLGRPGSQVRRGRLSRCALRRRDRARLYGAGSQVQREPATVVVRGIAVDRGPGRRFEACAGAQ